jgi:hypothetical protein
MSSGSQNTSSSCSGPDSDEVVGLISVGTSLELEIDESSE